MATKLQLDEWDIVLIRQIDWPPFLPWCAFATRKVGNKVYVFNVEGTDKADAIRRVRLRLLQGGGVITSADRAGGDKTC